MAVRRLRIRWWRLVANLVAFVALGLSSVVWVAWLGAMDSKDIPKTKFYRDMPANAKALIMIGDARVRAWPLGTVKQNPVGFGVCTAIVAVSGIVLFWSGCRWFRGMRKRPPRPPLPPLPAHNPWPPLVRMQQARPRCRSDRAGARRK